MKKILIVDDEMVNRMLLKRIISKISSEVEIIEADNGQNALELIEKNVIDLILLDIVMPVMDGIDLLKILKNDTRLADIPVAILTTDDSRKKEALHYGACEVLIKPIKKPDVEKILQKFL
jgi:CheY-like chemotaxis protein